MPFEFDASLLQDFLIESAELIDQLDADLVRLEAASDAAGGAAQDLCNSCFRALHTIKGAASFLALTPVTTFAHAAEDTLNRLRKGEVEVTPDVMDALLQSADVVRRQIESLASGEDAEDGPAELIARLEAIASGQTGGPTQPAAGEPAVESAASAATGLDFDADPGAKSSVTPDADALDLPSQKLDLLEFMVADLHEYAGQIEGAIAQLFSDATRADGSHHLAEIADNLVKTAEFFELDDLTRLARAVLDSAPRLAELPTERVEDAAERLREIGRTLEAQADALSHRRAIRFDAQAMIAGLERTMVREPVPAAPTSAATEPTGPAAESRPSPARESTAEPTIRVEVSRLESLLNLVGQLVLNKNRLLALTRDLVNAGLPPETAEQFTAAAGDLDHLMSELQVGVMRTRMQPLAKLFDRYPRVIRDIARTTQKKINLVIDGKETEVDKSVLEQLADPLVHILRNSADHGIEDPAKRETLGKPEEGTIRLQAEHQGSHVRVAITDDGKGLDREMIGRKAVERGLTTPDALAQMSDSDVFRFIFEAGFSTADTVSDLSGRGVGMDVVRTNISKLNGTINIESTAGQGTTIEVLIPLTVAIMPAMIVGIGRHLYSIPLQCVIEIVRPEPREMHTIARQPVLTLRDSVLPLIDMRERLGERHRVLEAKTPVDESESAEALASSRPFAIIVRAGGQQAGLMVDRLIGQQEIVIKPLDDAYTQGGPFSGATIREDGEVSLILDVVQLIRSVPGAAGTGPGPADPQPRNTRTYQQAA